MSHLKACKKVIPLNNETLLNIPAERVLNGALEADLEDVVILGKHSGGNYYFASSVADGGTVLWMWEKLKHELFGISCER